MANTSSEVGACKINIESYKCSIKKITVSTKWKAPTAEIAETVTTTVYDNKNAKWGKTIYLVSSPEGKNITIKAERENGKCPRDDHKKYLMSLGKQNLSLPSANLLNPKQPVSNSDNKKKTSQENEKEIKNEEELTIKCFNIDAIKESFKYLWFPIPIVKDNSTSFKYISCKEGTFQYIIISYPDISARLEFSIGTEAKKNRNKTSPFEKKTSSLKNVPSQLKQIDSKALDVELNFSPSLTATTTCNGGKDELEFTVNFDKKKEFAHLKLKHDSNTIELGSEFLQDISGKLNSFVDIIKLLVKICEIDFLKELRQFDATKLVNNYKPYKLNLAPPNVLFFYEGKYQTSKDLTKIGKLIDIGIACEPLIKISFTVDLLFLILSAVSAGTATGFYVMLKNLDKVIGKILGDNYKKTYKDTKPFEADVYFNFIVSGAINGSLHWIINTTEKANTNSYSGAIKGVLKADLEAGAKLSLDVFIVAVEGEASASGSTGIKIKLGLENRILQGSGFVYLIEGIFLGIKIKYCVKGKVGLMKTTSYGGSLVDGDATLMKETYLFSQKWTVI